MIGTITNCCTILAGSVIGATLPQKGIKEQYQENYDEWTRLSCISTRYQ